VNIEFLINAQQIEVNSQLLKAKRSPWEIVGRWPREKI
jgi:hypothetical protein